MANTNARGGHRSTLSFSSFNLANITNRHRSRPERVNTNTAASMPTGGYATTSSIPVTSPRVASPQHDASGARSSFANPSPPTRRPQAPPPYSPTSPRQHTEVRPPREDEYALLGNYDTIFVIDDSASMQKHWEEVNAILGNIAPICTRYDRDGIDIYFVDHENKDMAAKDSRPPGKAPGAYNNVRDAQQVEKIFNSVRPSAPTTLTGTRMRSILQEYMRFYAAKLEKLRQIDKYGELDQKEVKPINVIVFTDGKPNDNLEDELVRVAEELDTLRAPLDQVGVQFFQVGDEKGAAEYFQGLDNNLGKLVGKSVRDIVDHVTWDAIEENSSGHSTVPKLGLTAEGVHKVVLGAVVKRLDRQETKSGRGRTGSHGTAGTNA